MISRDNVRGAIVGLAVGDALGFPTEFIKRPQILQRFGPHGVTDFVASRHPAGTYTDDTQMSIAVAEGLLDAGIDAPIDALMDAIADRFVTWSRSPDNNRAPGVTCMRGCARLAEGVPWRAAGVADSKGCGSAMRVAPIGIVYEGGRLAEVARASSLLTHGHDAALEGAVACALGVAFALRGATPNEVRGAVLEACAGRSKDFDDCMARFDKLRDAPPELALSTAGIGEAWVAEEAFATALYCWARTPRDFAATVLCGANTDGDSDSIAAIAGSFCGASLGLDGIPAHWISNVENSASLIALADRLYDAR